MNMAKKQNSFSSTKRDRNGENVPAIAGVEINEIRMYSIEGKMYLPETDLPKLEYRLKAKNFIAERFTGMTDSYGIPIFEGDVIYQEYWLENMKLDMWHFVCWMKNWDVLSHDAVIRMGSQNMMIPMTEMVMLRCYVNGSRKRP